ncbi:Unknown protein, partial [Striga hermonthica]
VNRLLSLHSGESIDKLRISFELDISSAHDIDRWIKFAFSKWVKRLALEFVQPGYLRRGQYTFPNQGLPVCESLVSLILRKVAIDGETLEFFLNKCPLLEELHVEDVNYLRSLKASCCPNRLRRLAVIGCLDLRMLEICSPALVSFTLDASEIVVTLKNVSSIVDLTLEALWPSKLSTYLFRISGCLAQLETLTLCTPIMQEIEELEYPNLPRSHDLPGSNSARPPTSFCGHLSGSTTSDFVPWRPHRLRRDPANPPQLLAGSEEILPILRSFLSALRRSRHILSGP